MPQRILIQSIPNQQFTLQLDNNFYSISLKYTAGVMSASIFRNNVLIASNARTVAGVPIIGYYYLEDGNFVISTVKGDLPDYTKFGITQFLIYFSQTELNILRGL